MIDYLWLCAGCLGNGDIFVLCMLLWKCDRINGTLLRYCFKLKPNVIFATYVVRKRSQDELSICCMTFAYVYYKCLALIIFVRNCMGSFGYFFIMCVLNDILCSVGLESIHVF